jgi:HEAT repeat protein
VPRSGEQGFSKPFLHETRLPQAEADLKHPDPKIRIMAIRFMQKAGLEPSSLLLQETLSDPDPEVRLEAIRFMTKLEPSLEPSLLKKTLKDPDAGVRMAALQGLFRSGERLDLTLLLQLLSDESPWVRRKIATLLGWYPMEGVLPVLVELSKDGNPGVRKAALISLSSLYSDESEDRLIKALTDPDHDIRDWAKRSLEKTLKEPKAVTVRSFGKDRG